MNQFTIDPDTREAIEGLATEIQDTAAITHWAADMSDSTERPFGRQALRIKKLAEQVLELLPKDEAA